MTACGEPYRLFRFSSPGAEWADRISRCSRAKAAEAGVRITNRSDREPLVMLKHFGPGNPDAARLAH